MQNITFYQRFKTDILFGKKTITIRDKSEKNYIPGTVVQALTYEEGKIIGRLQILSVESILLSKLNLYHAQQENMSLRELKTTIEGIYPNTQNLYLISFKLI